MDGSAPRGKTNEQARIVPYVCAGDWSPSAPPRSSQAIGRSTSRLRPKPRGRRPSTAALTISGARKASDRVIRIERTVSPPRKAIDSKSQGGMGQKFVQPAMSVAKGIDQDRARVGGHRTGIGLRIVCALNDLALAIR